MGERAKDSKNLPPAVQKAMKRSLGGYAISGYTAEKKAEIRAIGKSIQALETKYGRSKCIYYVHFLEPSDLDSKELGDYLRANFDELWSGSSGQQTYMRKLVCLYDHLKYGPGVRE